MNWAPILCFWNIYSFVECWAPITTIWLTWWPRKKRSWIDFSDFMVSADIAAPSKHTHCNASKPNTRKFCHLRTKESNQHLWIPKFTNKNIFTMTILQKSVWLYCKVKLQGGSIPQNWTHTLTTIWSCQQRTCLCNNTPISKQNVFITRWTGFVTRFKIKNLKLPCVTGLSDKLQFPTYIKSQFSWHIYFPQSGTYINNYYCCHD